MISKDTVKIEHFNYNAACSPAFVGIFALYGFVH